MTNAEVIEAIRRLLYGQRLSVVEADAIHALVRQNTQRTKNG